MIDAKEGSSGSDEGATSSGGSSEQTSSSPSGLNMMMAEWAENMVLVRYVLFPPAALCLSASESVTDLLFCLCYVNTGRRCTA